jgi:hypothetical protein
LKSICLAGAFFVSLNKPGKNLSSIYQFNKPLLLKGAARPGSKVFYLCLSDK